MSVQVIMKDGRPEWAVIPYEQYEALLAAAGKPQAEPSAPDVPGAHSVPASPPAPSSGQFSTVKLHSRVQASAKSEAELAKDAGISPAYLAQISAGERAPSPAIIRGLAQALGIKADDLLG